ncbi:MAG: YgeY family selenium metabolism-linked hydrolase, partial [Candidatus Eisenbacteria sp.]|nr:YgeY family selenium metabolism-linked hydrolase [Candidatus Eisenbacteria bacterium]
MKSKPLTVEAQMDEIREAAAQVQEEAVQFLREIIRIPSLSGHEGKVVEAVSRQMEAVGFDEVRVDPFGNVMGRIGHGKRILA